MTKHALIVFTRIPVAGRVKTRLMPYLSAEACAALQRAMTRDTVETLAALEPDLYIFYSDEGSVELLGALPEKAHLMPQQGEDLGERMYRATEQVLTLGYESCLLLGADLPFLTEEAVAEAGRALEGKDMVFCPAPDGGYWLIGMHKPFRPVFQNQPYGTGSVLRRALICCASHGLTVGLGPVWQDLDTPEDLLCCVKTLEAAPKGVSATLQWLKEWNRTNGQ